MIRQLTEQAIIRDSRKRDVSLYNEVHFKGSLALQYAVNSKFTKHKLKKLSKRTNNFYNPFVLGKAAQPFKMYSGAPTTSLKDYQDQELPKDLFETIAARKSSKKYQRYDISFSELHFLMRYSYGVNRNEPVVHEGNSYPWMFRAIPSPGGLFASEVYLVILNGQMEKGVYHYRPDIHALELIKVGDFTAQMEELSGGGPYIEHVADLSCVVLVTSMIERLYIKYGERGYRFMLMEVGFLAQNLSLVTQALDLGCCMLGGYLDDSINDFLEVDGIFESIQNVMVIGKPR